MDENLTVNQSYPGSNKDIIEKLKQTYEKDQAKKNKFPTEILELPSKGLLYSEKSGLSSGKIEMKYLSAKEEDILTSQNLIRNGTVLDMLFKSMIVSNIDYNEIIAGDKDAIMVTARILGYGKNFNTIVTCPGCGKEIEYIFNLMDIKTKYLDESNVIEKGVNNFKFTLPYTKREVTFKFLTNKDEEDIEDALKKLPPSSDGVNHELSTRMKYIITSVDGNTDKKYISDYIDNGELISLDSKDLRAYMNKIKPGIDSEVDFHCSNPSCVKPDHRVNIPISKVDFFYPKV